jgi:hypothetical protein
MSDSTAPNSAYRFSSQEFLGNTGGVEPSKVPIDITSALWHLWTKYWLAILITTVVGYILPTVVVERVLQIKLDGFDAQTFRSNPLPSIFAVILTVWEVLASAYLTLFILNKEYHLNVDGRAYVLKTWPILLLSFLVYLGLMIGALLLIIPSIIFYCATVVAGPVLLVEEENVIGSIKRSIDMTRGHRWTIFWGTIGYVIFLVLLAFGLGLLVWPVIEAVGGNFSFAEIGAFFDPVYDVAGTLFPIAIYSGLRKFWRGDEPDELASLFD